MFSLLNRPVDKSALLSSRLFNEETFYEAFTKDLNSSLHEVIIESPFITTRRLMQLMPVFKKLKERRVRVIVNTRYPYDHKHEDIFSSKDAHGAIAELQLIGVQVVYTTSHHRKLAIIDRNILYEGSLNILSQNQSCEIMRRIESTELAWQMSRFIAIDKYLS